MIVVLCLSIVAGTPHVQRLQVVKDSRKVVEVMTYMDLQALRHYVYQTQKIIYETRSCIIIECDKCECAYIAN